MRTAIHLSSGEVSAYGLACGYVDVHTRQAESGPVEIRLSHNGATYDVDVVYPGKPREWIELEGGARILQGWAQFDKLGDARKFARRMRSVETVGVAFAHCLTKMTG